MANVSVIFQMTAQYLPFERPPDPRTLWTAIPRGLRGFVVEDGTLPLKPVNDTETLHLQATLPGNFAYVFAGMSLSLRQDRAGDWFSKYTLSLTDYHQGSLVLRNSWNFEFTTSANLPVDRKCDGGGPDRVPRQPMWAGRGSSGISIAIDTFNATATVATSGFVNCFINFWEFDLEQARKYPINTPIPTQSR